jgi:hypothetical protein
MKLPVVFQHFQEHLRMGRKISFGEFLAEHYLHDDPKDPDYARDMQLPFKTYSHYFFMLIPAAAPKVVLAELPVNMQWQPPGFPRAAAHTIPVGYHMGIFQPPRQA